MHTLRKSERGSREAVEKAAKTFGRATNRGMKPARQTDTTPVAEVMTWEYGEDLQPHSMCGARNLGVVAMW